MFRLCLEEESSEGAAASPPLATPPHPFRGAPCAAADFGPPPTPPTGGVGPRRPGSGEVPLRRPSTGESATPVKTGPQKRSSLYVAVIAYATRDRKAKAASKLMETARTYEAAAAKKKDGVQRLRCPPFLLLNLYLLKPMRVSILLKLSGSPYGIGPLALRNR